MLLWSWMLQLIRRRNTQCSICKCLNCSSVSLCPKAFQPGVERMLVICLCDPDTSHRKQDVCHWTFLSLWQPASLCSLVYCWLCSCFPSRSGAPDDGRPRYGLCSFSTLLPVFSCSLSTLLPVFSCSLAAFTPLLQRMGECLQVIWLQIKCITLFTFFHMFFSRLFVGLVLVCSFDVYFPSFLHYNICK